MCIQVNIDGPLNPKVFIGHHIQPVIYEGLNSVCFWRGKLGHKDFTCSLLVSELIPPPLPLHLSPANKLGPWMVVRYKKNKNYNRAVLCLAHQMFHISRQIKFGKKRPLVNQPNL